MLRITIVESSREAVRLRVEGRVTGGWVEELRRACELHALCDEVRLTLDLADVFIRRLGRGRTPQGTERSLPLLS